MPTPSNYGTTRGSPAQKQGTPYEDMESEIEHPTSQKSTRDDSITDSDTASDTGSVKRGSPVEKKGSLAKGSGRRSPTQMQGTPYTIMDHIKT